MGLEVWALWAECEDSVLNLGNTGSHWRVCHGEVTLPGFPFKGIRVTDPPAQVDTQVRAVEMTKESTPTWLKGGFNRLHW